ncbi:MAG: oligosaccharide flippase family protein [Phycisphaerales bacterium]|nr:oligosaccharide flippase family protein [Phycisphaerales bacterium]
MSERTEPQSTKNSLALAVAANWTSHVVFLVSGFLLPRMIDRTLGRDALGVWDFAWSLAAYTSLLALGVSSAISRFVSRYRQMRDDEGLCRTYSASLALLWASFALGCAAVAIFVSWTPWFLEGSSERPLTPELLTLARNMVALLGLAAAIQLPVTVYSGVLSGCQRFDLRTGIRVGCSGVALALMIAALLAGAGLEWVALTYLVSELAMGVLNWAAAKRLCPELCFHARLVTRAALWEVLGFGGKTVLQSVSRMGLYQTSGLIVTYFLGPAWLAVYSRQRALTQFVYKMMSIYGNVFTPEASALEAAGDREGLRALVVKSSRFGFAIALPFVVTFSLGGGAVLRLWMGADYQSQAVLAILMLGHLMTFAQRGTFNILIGMNRHGTSSLWELASSAGSIGLGLLFVPVLNGGLVGAALAVGLAVLVGGGLAPAWIACRVLEIPFARYLREVLPQPVLYVTPLGAVLAVCAVMFPDRPYMQLGVGLGLGGAVTVPIYWRHVLTDSLRERFRGRIRRYAGLVGFRQSVGKSTGAT